MMSDSGEGSGLDDGHIDAEVFSHSSGNSLISLLTRTPRLGIGANRIFRQPERQLPSNAVQENNEGISSAEKDLEKIAKKNPEHETVAEKNPDNGAVAEKNTDNGAVAEKNTDNGAVAEKNPNNGAVAEKKPDNGAVAEKNTDNGAVAEKNTDNGAVAEKNTDNGAVAEKNTDNGAFAEKNTDNGAFAEKNTDNGAGIETKLVNSKDPVKWQRSNSTSGYSSAQDLTPENNGAEAEVPPFHDVLPECVGETLLRSGDSKSFEHSASIELSPDPLPNNSRQPSLQQHHSHENISGPSVSNFFSSDTASHPEDTESITVSQESIDPNEDIIEKIRSYSSCFLHNCTDEQCRAGRLKIEALRTFLDESDAYTVNKGYFFEVGIPSLRAIIEHSEYCEEIRCKIPLCYFYKQKPCGKLPWKLHVKLIREEYFSGNPVLMSPGSSVYKKLMYSSVHIPVEGAHFNNLTRIGDFGNSVIALSGEERSEHWWIKRCHFVVPERMEQTMEVMEIISNSPNPNVLPQLWYIKQEEHLLYATPYTVTLAQKLKNHKGKGFREEACWMLMQQMVNAASFLHSRNVLYLNWQCKNVAFDEGRALAKITNFTNSVKLPIEDAEEQQDVMATLQEWMFVRLIPPEIYRSEHLGCKSDVWGIASLLYEMVTGNIIHEHYRHEEPSAVREMLAENPVVNLDKVQSTVIKKLLRKSLKVSWSDRLTLEDFRTNVIQCLSECQQQHSSS